ncbi:glucans biosynthesis glucosyltransferase MdoH [Salipiger mucosus]|uniref:Glucans biosynthesis glucosyltransferase H n=1 Tax=Salipiger mucosus DSM 16094 TaxID=1123237 RepID=S9QGK9_9RHOB|nr:glucans biosynthesis glucosyltransferase MdoH [Salipiger mucosus]EPX78728.1 Glucans biosynthesis glucosyltransferase H [Salipiger mucosus DSM 16094]
MPDTPLMADGPTRLRRVGALAFAALAAAGASVILAQVSAEDGFAAWDALRTALIFITTAWLAWGAVQAFLGLPPRREAPVRPELAHPHPPTVVLLPICNEDPVAAFARVSAMDGSLRAAGLDVDIAVLSDTKDASAIAREQAAFAVLLERTGGAGRIFYRNREDSRGRKAGNIEDFIRNSGGAYEFAVTLDADSLMEGETIRTMIARMQAEPDLGLLQTLPQITGAHSLFGRALQFAAAFHSPIFARGLARLQGRTGPYWGHNAIVRTRALARCCGLPELAGRPPFGGTILSHDYVEAALLARGGWRVTLDETIGGSYEEGPDNITAFARRDRRWCQGNLQHMRLLTAPGLHGWSRVVFVQGILAYLVSLLWGAFLLASVVATVTATPPDYFPQPAQLFPVFPDDRTREIIALGAGVGGLLLLPKLSVLAGAIAGGRVRGFGGALRAAGSVIAEILLTSVIAPLMLMYQSRAVLEVFSGRDGGWPANQRGEGRLSLAEGWQAGRWIALWGAVLLGLTAWLAPVLALWLLPVGVPMMLAPLLISATSQPLAPGLFVVPQEQAPGPVIRAYRTELARWRPATDSDVPAPDHGAADAAV